MEAFNNLWRRKGRSILTIGGVFVGILALTILGAMAEKINAMISSTERLFASQIMVMPKRAASNFGNDVFTEEQLEAIRAVSGVEAVVPRINLLVDIGEGFAFGLGLPPMIQAVDLSIDKNEWTNLSVRDGVMLTNEDEGWTVLGADLAKRLDAVVHEPVTLNGREFTVKGILEKTLSGPDNMALLNIGDGRKLLGIETVSLATSAAVVWEEGIDPEELSKQISESVEGVMVLSPASAKELLGQAMLVINLVILGAAGVAIVVGGMAVINTMMMSISERTQEIGIKMAVGAQTKDIMKEFLFESGLIGLIGGIFGVGIGYVVVRVLNAYTMRSGAEIFYVSNRLVGLAIAFAIIIGIAAGLYPAYRASRLSCVQALRRE